MLFVLSPGLVLEFTHPHWCCFDVKSFYVSCSTTHGTGYGSLLSWFYNRMGEFSSAKALRRYMFKQLFPIPGCITKHILCAHLQANLVARPILLTLGW